MQAALRAPEQRSETAAPDMPLGDELSTNGIDGAPAGAPEQAFERPRSRGGSAGELTSIYG
jgi:hypothetical protein